MKKGLLLLALAACGADDAPDRALSARSGAQRPEARRAAEVDAPAESEASPARDPLELVEVLRSGDDVFEAIAALQRLGADAAPAVPALLRVLEEEDHRAMWVLQAIAAIGPAARDAVPAATRHIVVVMEARAEYKREHPGAMVSWIHTEYSARDALVAIGEPSIAPMIELLGHALWDVRYHAGEVLEELMPKSVPALMAACRDPSAIRRAAAAEVLGAAADTHPELFDPLRAMLDDEDETVRREAMESLAAFGARAAPLLASALRSNDRKAQYAAANAFEKSPGAARAAVPALAEALMSGSASVRSKSLRALSLVGADAAPAASALASALGERSDHDARYAVHALAAIGEPALGVLTTAAASPDARTRRRAIDALSRIEGAADAMIPAYQRGLDSDSKEERWAAATALARRGLQRADVIAALDDLFFRSEEWRAMHDAAEALAHYRGADAKAAISFLLRFLEFEGARREKERTFPFGVNRLYDACSETLVALGKEHPALLIDGFRHDSEHVRDAASRALAKIESPALRPLLIKASKGESARTRERAARSLARFAKQDPASKEAIEWALSDASWRVRISAAGVWFQTFGDAKRAVPIMLAALREIPERGPDAEGRDVQRYTHCIPHVGDAAAFAREEIEAVAKEAANPEVRRMMKRALRSLDAQK